MRAARVLCVVVIACFIGIFILSTRYSRASGPRVDDCRRQPVAKTVRCLARNFDSPGSPRYAVSIARCESGLYPHASSGSHLGLFQQSRTYWPGRYRAFARPLGLRPSPFAPLTNTVTSIRMARAAGTWSRDWSCA